MRFPYRGSGIGLVYNDRILLGKRSVKLFNGKWCVPGGGREKSLKESDLECAKREFFEETGIAFESLEASLVGKWSLSFPFFKWTTFFFKTDDGEADFKPNEFSELRWVPIDDVLGLRLRPFGRVEMKLMKKVFGR